MSVGFPFFDRTFAPMMVPLLLAVGAGPMLAWKRGDLPGALQRLWAAFAVALVVVAGGLVVTQGARVLSVLGIALAAWVFTGAAVEWAERVRLFRGSLADSWGRALHLPRAAYGMTLAHMGVAVTVAGISASSFAVENIQLVKIGGDMPIGGYTLHLAGIDRVPGANFTADQAVVEITRDGAPIATVRPERRFFRYSNRPPP